MADDKPSANSSATSTSSSHVRSSSKTPSQIYRSWARDHASRASEKDQRRLKLFETLEKFVRSYGGCITTPPNEKRIRIECPQDSDLLDRLGNYHPILIGQSMRTSYAGFQQMDVIEISLDK